MRKRLGTPEEYQFVDDMANFVLDFKRRRNELGLAQSTIGAELVKIYGKEFSHETVSRFENLDLSLRNTCNVKPFLEKWINDYEELQKSAHGGPFSFPEADEALLKMLGDQKKDRENISAGKQEVLEQFYFKNCRPFTRDINRLAQELDLCKEGVRIWFRNRQAKDQRENISAGKQEVLEQFYVKNCIPSTRDINRLSQELDLCKEGLRIWFRNRQAKDKKGELKDQAATSKESPQEPSTSQQSSPHSSHSEESSSLEKDKEVSEAVLSILDA